MDTYIRDPHFVEALWEKSPVPCAIVSTSGVFTKVNRAWAELLGYSKAELLGHHFRTITHPADIDDDQSEVARILADPDSEGYSMEKRYISKRGATVWVELHVQVIRDQARTAQYFVVIVVPRPIMDVGEHNNDRPVLTRLVDGCVRVLTERTRECLVAFVIVLVAVRAIPVDSIVKLVESYFSR